MMTELEGICNLPIYPGAMWIRSGDNFSSDESLSIRTEYPDDE